MRISAVTACLAASLAPAAGLSVYNGKAPSIAANPDQSVPGESPLQYCHATADRSKDLVVIDRVDLFPNPPVPGAELFIKAEGTVKKTIEKGAYVNLLVKYGLITILNTKADLCDEITNVDMECPIKDGHLEIVKKVDIPKEVPPGTYNVMADVYSKEDEQVTCLTASVSFRVGSFFGGDL